MTNFTAVEFQSLWDKVAEHTGRHWNKSRERRCQHNAKDAIYIPLSSLKQGGLWDFTAYMFGMKAAHSSA